MATNNQVIGMMFANYGETNELRLKGYCLEFAGINTQLLAAAVRKLQRERQFVPTIADIYAAMEGVREEVTGKKEFLDWDEAWDEIHKGWCSGSPYKEKPKWSTPEIAHVVESFGWLSLLSAPESQTQTIRAQMKVMYEMACKRAKEHRVNQEVLGIAGVPKDKIPAKISALIAQISAGKGMVKV